jgi:hypothetical protein
MAQASDVIDWDEAMEQCGDDEEFLRELLADLRGETDAQMLKIEETIRVRRNLYTTTGDQYGSTGPCLNTVVTWCSSESNRGPFSQNNASCSCHQGCSLQFDVLAASGHSNELGTDRFSCQ